MTVEKIEAAIAAYNAVPPQDGDAEIILCRMLAGLRVFADLHALDFAVVDRAAYAMYLEAKHVP